MKIKLGQQCWVGWAHKKTTKCKDVNRHICRVVTVDGGPFGANEPLPGASARISERSWHIDTGAYVAERLLTPFQPDEDLIFDEAGIVVGKAGALT
jgi:hypothetical protein